MFEFDSYRERHYEEYRHGRRWSMDDGWGKTLTGTEDDHFVYRQGYAFAKALTSGNYHTPEESNYGFGTHVIVGEVKPYSGEDILSDYDDRLRSWYPQQWEASRPLLLRGGARYPYAALPVLSEFLTAVYGQSVTCLQVLRGCNVSSGYPFHIFISRKEVS
jgi:hypothetical protein